MSAPRIGELFSGYGGLGMGVQSVLGGDVVWHSEIDKGACKVLAHRYPDVPNLGDITAVDWSQVEPVDVLTGGSPCQDLSHAGKRAGMSEGTRSNLWVAMREAIAALRPSLVVWENVRGAYSAGAHSELESRAGLLDGPRQRDGEPVLRALGRVLGDLAELGYDAQWYGLRAADIGAPHGRFRVFLVATPADTASEHGLKRWISSAGETQGGRSFSELAGRGGVDALLPTPRCADGMRANLRPHAVDTSRLEDAVAAHLLPTPTSRDHKGRNQRNDASCLPGALHLLPTHENRWGEYAPAIARWEHRLGRPAPEPTQLSRKGNPQLSAAFVEWMMGLPAGWVTDVPDVSRNEALKMLGNGVVPQQCAMALRIMLDRVEVMAA